MRTYFYLLILVMLGLALAPSLSAENKQIMGWREKARLLPENLVVLAKLDSGADNSSLNVLDVTEFSRDGEDWVRFSVTGEDGKSAMLERRLIRTAKIKRHGARRQERPVVLMGICIGNYYKEVEVNLEDRSRFKCQLLVGRSFMAGSIVIDPDQEDLATPECGEANQP